MIKVIFQINRKYRLFNTPSCMIIWKKNILGSPPTHCIKMYSIQVKCYHLKLKHECTKENIGKNIIKYPHTGEEHLKQDTKSEVVKIL